MKKEIVKTFVITTLILLVVLLSVKSMKCYQEARKQPEPVYLTKTLTQVIYDTLFIDHFETVKLPTTDTLILINDSIRVDSVFVEVPISVYKLDTTFTSDSTVLNIFVQNKGFNVTLDSLSYYFEYTPTPIKLPKKNYFREHFKFGLGIGTGFGVFSKKPDIFVGIGVYYTF